MLIEIGSAAGFLSNLIRTRCENPNQVEQFRECLQNVLSSHYDSHWFPEKPFKGSGYRCLRIVNNKMDPLLSKAGHLCGLSPRQLLSLLPSELTMWIDPAEVSYRIGEEGSIGVLYGDQNSSSSEDSASSGCDSDASSQGAPSPTQEILGGTCKSDYSYYQGHHQYMGMEYLSTPQYVAS